MRIYVFKRLNISGREFVKRREEEEISEKGGSGGLNCISNGRVFKFKGIDGTMHI